MALTREAVIWAYRLLLGREPENETVIELAMAAGSIAALRRAFIDSPEFAESSKMLSISRHIDVPSIDVETNCTPAELARMTDGIAANWRRFGETEPHWSVLVSDVFRADRIGESIEQFYATGRADVQRLLLPLGRSGLPIERFENVLDFGCGVGRLTLALADRAGAVTGVDISAGHLALARERAAETGLAHARFEQISAVDDLSRYRGFDLVVSLIVLQHNPPPVMAELLRKLLAALRPGGAAVIQMPTYIAGTAFRVQEYLASPHEGMEMHALPQHVIFRIVEEAGCQMLEVREDGAAGAEVGLSHTFAMQKR